MTSDSIITEPTEAEKYRTVLTAILSKEIKLSLLETVSLHMFLNKLDLKTYSDTDSGLIKKAKSKLKDFIKLNYYEELKRRQLPDVTILGLYEKMTFDSTQIAA